MQNAPYSLDELILVAPLEVHGTTVKQEWTDWNGHMNVGYYVIAFDHCATLALCRQLGIAAEYTREKIGMYFVLECHVTYEREIVQGDQFDIRTQIVDYDGKRLHVFHTMYLPSDGSVVATNEVLLINVDYNTRRSAPWPVWAMQRIETLAAIHAKLPRPSQVGSIIGIRKKTQ